MVPGYNFILHLQLRYKYSCGEKVDSNLLLRTASTLEDLLRCNQELEKKGRFETPSRGRNERFVKTSLCQIIKQS